MKTTRRTLITLCLFLIFPALSSAQRMDVQSRVALIERAVAEEMQKNSIPGMAVAIALDRKIVYAKGFGFADLENQVPFTFENPSQ
jgi:CubicO group peptidase (beta-lactamase class C family)